MFLEIDEKEVIESASLAFFFSFFLTLPIRPVLFSSPSGFGPSPSGFGADSFSESDPKRSWSDGKYSFVLDPALF